MKDCFCSLACVDGSCPSNYAELYGESEIDCKDCWLNIGECEYCIFKDSSICPLESQKE